MLQENQGDPWQARLQEEEEEGGEVATILTLTGDTQALDEEIPVLVWVLEGQGLQILQAPCG